MSQLIIRQDCCYFAFRPAWVKCGCYTVCGWV